MKIILPIIFINYFICITFYTHSHIINGVTIVHSHPYQKDSDGKPTHEHSGAEIQLIHSLSTIHIAGVIVLLYFLGLLATSVRKLFIWIFLYIPRTQHTGITRLRPPPFSL